MCLRDRLNSIFEKFNRLDDARLSNTGGAGLGLSIAEEIIHLHGGKITASSQNETIDFVITLPLSAQENKTVILGITQEFKRVIFEIEKPLFGTMIIEQGLQMCIRDSTNTYQKAEFLFYSLVCTPPHATTVGYEKLNYACVLFPG